MDSEVIDCQVVWENEMISLQVDGDQKVGSILQLATNDQFQGVILGNDVLYNDEPVESVEIKVTHWLISDFVKIWCGFDMSKLFCFEAAPPKIKQVKLDKI